MKAKLDAGEIMRQYGAALRRLSDLTGMDQKAVLLGEAGIILKTWAGRTKVRTQAKTDKASRLALAKSQALTTAYDIGDITINVGIRGPEGYVWRRVNKGGKGGKFLLIAKLAKDGSGIDWGSSAKKDTSARQRIAVWANYPSVTKRVNGYVNALPKWIERGRSSAGLARQSVLQIADKLGIDLLNVKGGGNISAAGIAKARAALATTGRAYQNGTGTVEGTQIQTTVTLINSLPYATSDKVGMDRTLRGIMAGRAIYFQRSYAAGAFDTMKRTARAYPWLRVAAPAGLS